jgi:superfamily II DNA or RNA helicase
MLELDLNLNLLAEIGGWPALKEARALVGRGRVREAGREGAVLRGRVQGAEKVYDAQITLAARVADIEVRCTCAESRRSGRVCAHALAVGVALLPAGGSSQGVGTAPSHGVRRLPEETRRPPARAKRWLIGEAPAGTPLLEITVLLPLQWNDAFTRDSMRVILEAQQGKEAPTQPFDAAMHKVGAGFAVGEEDEGVLAALETLTGNASGINAVPRAKVETFLRALSGHPRVWLGKKQRIEVQASVEQPRIILATRPDGALELKAEGTYGTKGTNGRSRWELQEASLLETLALPAGFSSGLRMVPRDKIPDFLTREFPILERSCDLVFAPGFAEFQLEIGVPTVEARLEGALSGLTLDLVAHYDDEEFFLTGNVEPSAYQRFLPDARRPNRFWRRNVRAERAALAEVEAAGFSFVRRGTATFSLVQENQVARFLANTLPRWRRSWKVSVGPRLEEALREIDVAEPEFSLRSGSGEDWLSLDLKLAVHGKPVPLDPAEIQRWLQTGQSHARTADRRVLLVPTEAWSEMREVLAECEVEQEPGSGKVRVARTYAPFLTGALTANGFRAGGNAATKLPAPEVKKILAPGLWEQLRPYQAHGVEWLAGLAQQGFHGLLADDMGLGKTLQALTFCAWLKATQEAGTTGLRGPGQQGARGAREGTVARSATATPALVVCPTSLVTNWLREAARFTPHLRTLDLTGPDRAKKLAQRNNYDLLVTSYAILRRDVEHYRADDFLLVILDEAQHIKNRGSQNAQSAKALRARHRLILTGTPLENSVLDLWSLYDFLLPGYLGTATDFRERYETPLTRAPEPRLMGRLRHRVRPFFLRRTKEEVLTELPPKLEFPTLCELSDEQREVYRAVLAQGRREVFEHSDKAGRKSGRDRMAVLTTLLRLRQVCCHLDLLPTEKDSQGEEGRPVRGPSTAPKQVRLAQDDRSLEVADATPSHGVRRLPGKTSRWKEPSAKMERTFELIDEAIDGGHRVLLFSQFVRVLHLLREEAQRRELRFCYLDGQTVERQAEVDRFQNDAEIPLFFISLKAGGTGLNLTGADTVIHFDPWWNPAVEEQATSRAHRMGQARSVQAYKLIAAGTVEEKIQALQARKRKLFEASLGGDEAFVEKLTGEDLEELLAE